MQEAKSNITHLFLPFAFCIFALLLHASGGKCYFCRFFFHTVNATMKKTLLFTFGLVLLMTATGFSQKFGYCNSAVVLTLLPEVKAADSDLKAFQAQLTKRGQDMVKSLQEKDAELKRKQEQGTISPKELETQTAKLKEEEAKIGAYEQEMMQKLTQKREELFKPIFERFNNAMNEVAKEKGFSLVFDSNTQVVLYADESLDVTPLVKTKLGITN